MATVKFFGGSPSVIILRTSDNFNGTEQTGTPTLSPGAIEFPAQAGGGLYNFHDKPIEIMQITYAGAGSATVTKTLTTSESNIPAELGELTDAAPLLNGPIFLAPSEILEITSEGASGAWVSIMARLAGRKWGT